VEVNTSIRDRVTESQRGKASMGRLDGKLALISRGARGAFILASEFVADDGMLAEDPLPRGAE
jgi:hypothetical protein